jgi:uncharacterized protein involved in high-affinity Fe2+ transport
MKTLKAAVVSFALLISIPNVANADATPSPSSKPFTSSSAAPIKSKYSAEAKAAYKQAVEMAKSRFQLAVSDATAQLQEDIKAAGTNVAAIKAARAKYNLNYKQAFKAMTDYIASAKHALESSNSK